VETVAVFTRIFVQSLLETLAKANIQLTVSGDKLGIDAPKGALTDDLREAIRQHKAELLALLCQAETSPASGEPAGEGKPALCPKCGWPEWISHTQYDKVCAYLASMQNVETEPVPVAAIARSAN
jgi:hypothetical protein